ncbi:hypothetical protein V8C35DRAFT_296528 [Trichoderma chlorosporum]
MQGSRRPSACRDPCPGVYFLLCLLCMNAALTGTGTTPLLELLLTSPLLPAGDCETRQRHGYREKGPRFVNTTLEPTNFQALATLSKMCEFMSCNPSCV